MKDGSEPIILANSSSVISGRSAAVLFAVVVLNGFVLPGANQKSAGKKPARAKAASPTPAPAPLKMVGAAGLIAAAQNQLDHKNYSAAVEYAAGASSKTPTLRDYAEYLRAQAEYELKDYGKVGDSAKKIFDFVPSSPLVSPVAALAVRANLEGDRPKQALALITKYADVVPQPESSLLLARCYQANGDLLRAVDYFQRVYYGYPMAKEATDAANALVDLKLKLADALPPPTPKMLLGRAGRLFDAKNPGAARLELAAAIPQLTGAEQDVARVRLGVADFQANHVADAFAYLSALKVNDSEADAERLSYLIRCARKPDRHADVRQYVTELEQHHPSSKWRLDALVFLGTRHGRITTLVPSFPCTRPVRHPSRMTLGLRIAIGDSRSRAIAAMRQKHPIFCEATFVNIRTRKTLMTPCIFSAGCRSRRTTIPERARATRNCNGAIRTLTTR